MKQLYTASQIVAGLFGFSVLLGVIWFFDSLNKIVMAAGFVLGISSFIVACISQRKLSNQLTRKVVTTLCVLGATAGLMLIADDLGTSNGIEWHSFLIKLIHILVLAVMTIRALRWPHETT